MSWDARRLLLSLKDLRLFQGRCHREHSGWARGGSKVGENRPSARTVDFPFTSMPHSHLEDPRKDRQRSGRSTSREVRGGSRHEPRGVRTMVVLRQSSKPPAIPGYPKEERGSAKSAGRRLSVGEPEIQWSEASGSASGAAGRGRRSRSSAGSASGGKVAGLRAGRGKGPLTGSGPSIRPRQRLNEKSVASSRPNATRP